jgi:hypothetical protein
MIWPFGKKNKGRAGAKEAKSALTMADFFAAATNEVDAQIAADPQWFPNLPYKGAMSKDQARQFEIEKRAMWRRVIHDARRSDIQGLKWTTRGDGLVCPQCREREGQVFDRPRLAELEAAAVHLGCRCELVPERP